MNINNLTESQHCRYCRSAQTRFQYTVDDAVVRYCTACNLIFRENQDSEKNITNYYRNSYFQDWGDYQEGLLRDTIYMDALRSLEAIIGKGSLFDIGASNGRLLSIARSRGWEIEGQEISLDSCRLAKERYGIELISNNLTAMNWKTNHYDAITIVNVLDHLPNPWWVLDKIFRALKQGGVVYIRVPNGCLHTGLYRIIGSLPISALEEKIKKFLVIHLYHMTPRFLKRVLTDSGFGVVHIRNAKVSPVSYNSNFSADEAFWANILKRYFPALTGLIAKLTFGRLFVGSSIDVFAFKN